MGNSGFFEFRQAGQLESQGPVKRDGAGLGVQVQSPVSCLRGRLDDFLHEERANPVASPFFENGDPTDAHALPVHHPTGGPERLVLLVHGEEMKCDRIKLVDLDFPGDLLLHDKDPVPDREESIGLLRPRGFDDRNFGIHAVRREIESPANCKNLENGKVDCPAEDLSTLLPARCETPSGIKHPCGYLLSWRDSA